MMQSFVCVSYKEICCLKKGRGVKENSHYGIYLYNNRKKNLRGDSRESLGREKKHLALFLLGESFCVDLSL